LYEYEKDCNAKMLAMIDSVGVVNRADARFQQAVNLANHLAACRENWLDRMDGEGDKQVAWFEEKGDFATLRPRFEAVHAVWTEYLAALDDTQLARDFDFPTTAGSRFAVPTHVQLEQLVGHACYHRGQVALLVAQLGGETVDTDYLYWSMPR
jgi:uncharacterized damage-inducible protein DinB